MRTPRLSKPEAHLLQSPEPGRFGAAELERLPHQVLNPHSGFVRTARAAGIIVGSDCCLDGDGRLD